jgi:hypothetical protein
MTGTVRDTEEQSLDCKFYRFGPDGKLASGGLASTKRGTAFCDSEDNIPPSLVPRGGSRLWRLSA